MNDISGISRSGLSLIFRPSDLKRTLLEIERLELCSQVPEPVLVTLVLQVDDYDGWMGAAVTQPVPVFREKCSSIHGRSIGVGTDAVHENYIITKYGKFEVKYGHVREAYVTYGIHLSNTPAMVFTPKSITLTTRDFTPITTAC